MTDFPHIIHNEATRQRVLEHIQRLPLDRVWGVKIAERKAKRTLSQNALLHMWLSVIANETGNSLDDVKEAYRDMFLGKVAIKLGEKEHVVGRSTTGLDIQAMTVLLDQIYSHAKMELGIRLPLPEELKAA